MSQLCSCQKLLHYPVVAHVKVGIDGEGEDDEGNKGDDGGEIGQRGHGCFLSLDGDFI